MEDKDESAGAEAITLGTAVNPSLFWASYPPGVNREATICKHTIDHELREHFSQKRNRKSVFADDLKIHTKVVIEDARSQTWLRGEIEDRKLDGSKQVFDVFLIDIGMTMTGLDEDQIYLMPKKFFDAPAEAFLIALYGLEPLDVEVDLVAKKSVLEPAQSWSPNHFTFIKGLIKNAESALFKTVQVVNNVKHGILYLDINQERLDVNQKLVDSKHALQNDSVIDINKYLSRNKYYSLVKQTLDSHLQRGNTSSKNTANSSRGVKSPTSSKEATPKDEVDITGNNMNASSSTGRRSGGRPSAPIYPAGHIIQNLPKKKATSARKSADQEDFRRSPSDARPSSTQSSTHSRNSLQQAWSDDDSKVEFRIKSDRQEMEEKASKDKSLVSDKNRAAGSPKNSAQQGAWDDDSHVAFRIKSDRQEMEEKAAKDKSSVSDKKGASGKAVRSPQPEAWNDDSKIGFCVKSDDFNMKRDVSRDTSSASTVKNRVSGDTKVASSNKKVPGVFNRVVNFFSKSNDNDSESSYDDEFSEKDSKILSLYNKSKSESGSDAGSNICQWYGESGKLSNSRLFTDSSAHGITGKAVPTPERNTSNLSIKTSTPLQHTSTPTQNLSNLSTTSKNNCTPIQDFSCASSTSSGGGSRMQRELERSREFRRRSGNSTIDRSVLSETSSSKQDFDNSSDSTSQSSRSRSEINKSGSQCNLSVASSRSSQQHFGGNSLTDSMSETEESRNKKEEDEFEQKYSPYRDRVIAHDFLGQEVTPVESLRECDLDEEVKKALGHLRVFYLYRLQLFACPLIHEWRDVAMVHKDKAGKSISYVIPLLSLLHENLHYRQLKVTNCPKVVIVCPWSSTCENVANSFKQILNQFPNNIQVVTAYNCGKQNKMLKLAQLATNCSVLITTPRYLISLMKQPIVINLGHIYHFVLDGCHDLFKYFEDEVMEICRKISAIKVERRKVQVIAVSEVYNAAFDKLIRGFMKNPVLLIADAKEAAIYGNCMCKFTITAPENKTKALLNMLHEFRAKEVRTLIVCNQESLNPLHEILVKENYTAEAVDNMSIFDENMAMSRRSHLRCQLEGVHPPIVLCTDDDLPSLNMPNFHVLIHYDLPPTKYVFSARYFSIFEHIPNRLVKNCKKNYCKTGVILDTENNIQFPGILDYIKRFLLKVDISPMAEEIARNISLTKEEEKRDSLLCSRLLQFGECWVTACKQRHVFINDIDFPQFIPKKGFVKVKIMHALDASNFSARILEHSEDSVNWTHHTDNYVVFSTKLNLYFSDENNRYTKEEPAVGDIVVFQRVPNDFKRALVVEAAPKKRGSPQLFKIKYIDEGYTKNSLVPAYHLFTCPESFQEDNPYAIEVFVCGLKPVDLDHSWSSYAINHIEKEISKYQKLEANGYFFTGKIKLALDSKLWLEPFECQQFLESTKVHVVKFVVKQELLDSEFAVKNPEHLPKLIELCNRVELPVPVYEMPKVSKPVKAAEAVKPQWAFLPLDEANSSQSSTLNVFITHNDDPDMIFIQQVKFLDRLNELHRDIKEKLLTSEKIKKTDWKVGDLCLANFLDEDPNSWYRAEIFDKLSNEEVQVFYVDYGQEGTVNFDEIVEIDPAFITRLPFQAIECSLAAIRPIGDDGWENGSGEVIDKFMMDENGICKTIQAKAIQIDKKAKRTGGRRYSVVLRDITDNSNTIINRVLVEQGFAKLWRSRALYLDPSVTFKDVDSNSLDVEAEDDFEDLGDQDSPTEEVEDFTMQATDFEKFLEKYMESATEEDTAMLKEFVVDLAAKATNRDRASFEFESIAPPASPRIRELPSNQLAIGDGTGADLQPPLEFSGARSPLVLWHQSSTHIFMRVMLTGVGKYALEWGDNFLKFDTKLNDQLYHFEINFCGVVDSHQIEHSAKGFYVAIKLKKQVVGMMWQRLTLETFKMPWLRFNHDFCEDDDEEFPYTFNENQNSDGQPKEAHPDGFYEDLSEEASLQEAEARYNAPQDKFNPNPHG